MIIREKKTLDAQQWFRNGDHSDDACRVITGGTDKLQFWTEGKVVRYYRNPIVEGTFECQNCHYQMHIHGWIDRGTSGQTVCPGDWIIREGLDKYIAVPPGSLKIMYEEIK